MAKLSQELSVWQGLQMLPGTAPAPFAKLFTYFRWVSRPERVLVEPYEMHIAITKPRLLFCLRMGSQLLLVEQGLQDQVGQDMYVAARFAPLVPIVMSGTAFLAVLVSLASD